MNDGIHRSEWQRRARRVARQVNLGWWLETLAAPLLVAAALGAAGLLWLRREMPYLDPRLALAGVIAGLLGIALVCAWRASRRFESTAAAMVRIEATMGLRNALSAAEAGILPWPAPQGRVHAGLSWNWQRTLPPVIGALGLLAAGLWLPVGTAAARAIPAEPPQAWQRLATELEQLTEEQLVDSKSLEETRKRLDELQSAPEDQWFSHSSLEATDSLEKAHRSETRRVEREMNRAAEALERLDPAAGQLDQARKNQLAQQFDQARQGLQQGAMKPNAELLEFLKKIDPSQLGNLSPEQRQQLRDALQKNAEAMKQARGTGRGDEWSDELDGDAGGEDGDGEGKGPGESPGSAPGNGKGGIQRGPGHAPGVLGSEKDAVGTGDLASLQAKDLSQAVPGDLLELQDGEHDVDTSASGLREGGRSDAAGQGGDRVWKEAMDPAEQRAVKRYFQ